MVFLVSRSGFANASPFALRNYNLIDILEPAKRFPNGENGELIIHELHSRAFYHHQSLLNAAFPPFYCAIFIFNGRDDAASID
jgi:hypothetical protein